jgi:alpha-L-fucosidase
MADGTIPQGQKNILYAMGDWLRKFGSSIYATRTWSVYGEGPTKMGGGSFTSPVAGTANDIRYTQAKDGSAVYAIFLAWPGNGAKKTLTGFSSSKLKLTSTATVKLMGPTPGSDVTLTYTQDANGMSITFPSSAPDAALAYPVRVQLTPSTVGVETRSIASVAELGSSMEINGRTKVAVPEGAHWVTVLDAAGHELQRRNLTAADRAFTPNTRGTVMVRFGP